MFAVHWVRSALDDLATLWVNAASFERSQITLAASEIDRRLSAHPSDEGESREEGRRILLIPPLGVKYRSNEASHSVTILNVWRFKTHTS
jgi:hypothetical protein